MGRGLEVDSFKFACNALSTLKFEAGKGLAHEFPIGLEKVAGKIGVPNSILLENFFHFSKKKKKKNQ